MTAAAFQACYTDWRLIKGRKVVQVVLEIPIEQSDLAYRALNGMPDPGESVWVAVARLHPERAAAPQVTAPAAPAAPETEPPPGRPKVSPDKRLVQQAAILCGDPVFHRFLREEIGYESPADAVRMYCGVTSRAEIRPGTVAGKQWDNLVGQFEAWKSA